MFYGDRSQFASGIPPAASAPGGSAAPPPAPAAAPAIPTAPVASPPPSWGAVPGAGSGGGVPSMGSFSAPPGAIPSAPSAGGSPAWSFDDGGMMPDQQNSQSDQTKTIIDQLFDHMYSKYGLGQVFGNTDQATEDNKDAAVQAYDDGGTVDDDTADDPTGAVQAQEGAQASPASPAIPTESEGQGQGGAGAMAINPASILSYFGGKNAMTSEQRKAVEDAVRKNVDAGQFNDAAMRPDVQGAVGGSDNSDLVNKAAAYAAQINGLDGGVSYLERKATESRTLVTLANVAATRDGDMTKAVPKFQEAINNMPGMPKATLTEAGGKVTVSLAGAGEMSWRSAIGMAQNNPQVLEMSNEQFKSLMGSGTALEMIRKKGWAGAIQDLAGSNPNNPRMNAGPKGEPKMESQQGGGNPGDFSEATDQAAYNAVPESDESIRAGATKAAAEPATKKVDPAAETDEEKEDFAYINRNLDRGQERGNEMIKSRSERRKYASAADVADTRAEAMKDVATGRALQSDTNNRRTNDTRLARLGFDKEALAQKMEQFNANQSRLTHNADAQNAMKALNAAMNNPRSDMGAAVKAVQRFIPGLLKGTEMTPTTVAAPQSQQYPEGTTRSNKAGKTQTMHNGQWVDQ